MWRRSLARYPQDVTRLWPSYSLEPSRKKRPTQDACLLHDVSVNLVCKSVLTVFCSELFFNEIWLFPCQQAFAFECVSTEFRMVWSSIRSLGEASVGEIVTFNFLFGQIRLALYLRNRADRKSQVRQCLGLCTADFMSLFAYESAVQKPKHCRTWDFLSALLRKQKEENQLTK